jgi:oligosaccharide reducing-end xylanase
MLARPAATRLIGLVALLGVPAACKSTLDSLGCKERSLPLDGGVAPLKLAPLLPPASYPNAFRELLGKSDSEIAAKVADAFEQLFHGDAGSEAIYFPTGDDEAYIFDVLHGQVRTEGIGLGMLITVGLDKRDEFDRLWRHAKAMQIPDGPAQGYFPSFCGPVGNGQSCNDPYGLEQMVTALLLARGRWPSVPGTIDYGLEAAILLDLMRNKEHYNCGVVDGVTAPFDAATALPYDNPVADSAGVSRTSVITPAYYDLWYQATGDAFWLRAAAAGRALWQASTHPTTGLLPDKATFAGTPVPGAENFNSETLRVLFNMALDRIWSGGDAWLRDESDRLLQFFYSKGLTTYGHLFALDGTTIQSMRDRALIGANGTLALVASIDIRRDFVNEVWNLGPPVTGGTRYYPGIMQLLALIIMSGQLRVY